MRRFRSLRREKERVFNASTFRVPAFARYSISNLSIIRGFKRVVCFLKRRRISLKIQVVKLTMGHEETFACV